MNDVAKHEDVSLGSLGKLILRNPHGAYNAPTKTTVFVNRNVHGVHLFLGCQQRINVALRSFPSLERGLGSHRSVFSNDVENALHLCVYGQARRINVYCPLWTHKGAIGTAGVQAIPFYNLMPYYCFTNLFAAELHFS
jgi:hypothetical protein